MQESTIRLLVLVGYLVILLGVGMYQGKKVKSDSDYMMGGRKIPGWAAALSERATGESAWCLVGFPGYAYAAGLVSVWVALGLGVGNIVAWSVIARKMRDQAEDVDAITYVDWAAKKHPHLNAAIRFIGAMIIVFLFAFYVEAQLIGGGKTLNAMFGIKPLTGIIITLCIIIPYTFYGGYQSVVYTDCIQSILMITTLILGPIFAIKYLGTHSAETYAPSIGAALTMAGGSFGSWTGGAKGFAAGLMIGNAFSWFFAYLGGCPHLTVRFMSIKDDKAAKQARNIGIIWTIFGYAGAIMLGLAGLAIFGPGGLSDAETVMPMVVMTVFPPFVGALLVTSAIAAMLSTADSMLILTASELSEDIIKPFFLKGSDLTEKQSLWISRWVTLIGGLVSFALVFILPENLIYAIVSFAWAGLGNSFAVLTMMTLFWKKFNAYGAVWTMSVGFVTTLIWNYSPYDAVVSSRIVGFVAALLAAYIGNKYGETRMPAEPRKA